MPPDAFSQILLAEGLVSADQLAEAVRMAGSSGKKVHDEVVRLGYATGERVMGLMFEMNREAGTTLVLVTHDRGIAARCDRQLHIDAGRLLP